MGTEDGISTSTSKLTVPEVRATLWKSGLMAIVLGIQRSSRRSISGWYLRKNGRGAVPPLRAGERRRWRSQRVKFQIIDYVRWVKWKGIPGCAGLVSHVFSLPAQTRPAGRQGFSVFIPIA